MMGSFAKPYCYSSTMWACMWKSEQTEGRLAIYGRAGDSKQRELLPVILCHTLCDFDNFWQQVSDTFHLTQLLFIHYLWK